MRIIFFYIIIVLIFFEFSEESNQKHHQHRKRRKRQPQFQNEVHPEDSAEIIDYPDQENVQPELFNEIQNSWQNPDHPERRLNRYSSSDDGDEQTEFVRTEFSEQVYKKMRTYDVQSLKMLPFLIFFIFKICIVLASFDDGFGSPRRNQNYGTPAVSPNRQIECYSCMSMSYQMSWRYLQATYVWPKVFTDRCRDPYNEQGIPIVLCSSVCISMMEPDIEAGVLIGYKHIRGCMDKVLRNGFNQTALGTHRFHQNAHQKNHCRTLSRSALFNPAKSSDPPAIGDVHLCSCYGNKCNTYHTSSSSSIFRISIFLLLFFFTFF
ncbi:unnamed protein product [Caenorhabditis angaria]|uniref:Uncharacterized protein n=1 Tax=Caenorhabditis angaria TaxID=860376 RepID=A0A9P1IXQ3_9PELO|nr:unnamed protein product [Caenorhabditis angaria]